jgi:hypothetical protein
MHGFWTRARSAAASSRISLSRPARRRGLPSSTARGAGVEPLEGRTLLWAPGVGELPSGALSETLIQDALQADSPAQGMTVQSAPAVAAAVVTPAALSGMPQLNSRPEAPVNIFLDFDGEAGYVNQVETVPPTPAYDTDGAPGVVGAQEQSAIRTIWESVSEYFSPFNVNVTTVDPGNYAALKNLRVLIGGSPPNGANIGGQASVEGFRYGATTAFVYSNTDPAFLASSSAHEAGHALGLKHQSLWVQNTDGSWRKDQEYRSDTIMGTARTHSRWGYGPNSFGHDVIQDDLAVISGPANGFGYRPDEAPDDPSAAVPINTGSLANVPPRLGVIAQSSDVDWYAVTLPAGTYNFNVDSPSPPFASMLDPRLEVRDASGRVLASRDSTTGVEAVSLTLPAGTYRVGVAAAGGPGGAAYGNVGQYRLVFGDGAIDRFEPDNPVDLTQAFKLAHTLGYPGRVTVSGRTIHSATDKDYFHFTQPKNVTYDFDLAYDRGEGDLQLRVLTWYNGALQATSSDTATGDHLTWAAPLGLDFWIEVSGENGATSSGYTLDVRSPRSTYFSTARKITATGTSTVQVEEYDTGGEGQAYHDTTTTTTIGTMRYLEGVDLDDNLGGRIGERLVETRAGEWVEYTVDIATAGAYDVAFPVANVAAGGTFHLEVDGANVTGPMAIPNTGGFVNYQNVSKAGVPLPAGRHVLRLAIDTEAEGTGDAGAIDWMQFTPSATGAPTADVVDVAPDPRTTPVGSVQIRFSERVTGFDAADLELTRDGTALNLLTAAQTLTTGDNITWTLGNLSGVTAAAGT